MLFREISAGPADWFFSSSRLEPSPKTKPVKSPDFSAGWSRTMPTSSPSPCSRRTPTTRCLSPFDSWRWQGRWMMSASRPETPGSNLGPAEIFINPFWSAVYRVSLKGSERHLGKNLHFTFPVKMDLWSKENWNGCWWVGTIFSSESLEFESLKGFKTLP